MSNLRIDIASEFTGRKAFQQAEASTNSLDKAIGSLGKKMAAAFSAYQVAQFAKTSVKAFAEDQKAAALLAKTLQNVGQGYQTDMVDAYIAKTEALYGVLDDKLRPAFASLVVATKDAAKSQQLLQTALDVSAGTGKDLESVTAALSKAYLGNTTALARLGAGLSSASLKGKSFDDIVNTLNQNFSGAAATAADTYQGKIDRLNVAFKNMQETVGKGLVDAFSLLGQNSSFNGVINSMGSLATYISNTIVGVGVLASQFANLIKSIPGIGILGKVFKFSLDNSLIGKLQKLGAEYEAKKAANAKAITAQTAKTVALQKTQLTNAKALTKEQKDQLALDKASAELKKASGIFDLEKIELAAAAMAKQSDEDYARIKLKQDILALQDAINAGDVEAATKLAAIVDADYKRVQAYQAQNIALGIQNGTIINIKNAASLIPTDLKLIDLDNLNAALKAIQALIDAMNKLPKVGSSSSGGSTGGGLPALLNPDGTPTSRGTHNIPPVEDTPMETFMGNLNDAVDTLNKNTNALKPYLDSGFFDMTFNASEFSGANINPYQLTDAQAKAYSQGQTTVTIVDNTSGLINVITDATQQASANGINTRLVRNTGSLSW